MTDPEPLSPVAVERKLRQLVNDLTRAQLALAEARDAEVEAKHAYEAARRAALLSPDCPKVTRGGYTTAERDAWVSEQAANAERLYDVLEAKRKAAEDHLRVLRDQAVIVATLANPCIRRTSSPAGTDAVDRFCRTHLRESKEGPRHLLEQARGMADWLESTSKLELQHSQARVT